jgi:polar amino acid transport system permease protein
MNLSLGLVTSAYLSEVFRGALLSIDSMELLAVQSMGMSRWQLFLFIESPQMLRFSFPGMPQYGLSLSAFTVAVICFTLNVSAYNAAYTQTAYRALDPVEHEAAAAQGFGRLQIFRLIILPQVFSTSLPALTKQMIGNLKDSSIAFMIGYTDFFARTQELASSDFQFLYAYLFTAMIYLVQVMAIVLLSRRLECRLSRSKD